ncbi:hypothetical protein CCR75_008322 [Bremia lactucae]|uniref:Uncharacterized protein n=1 Tax=Bremia lactucae TaxID=4779 RepID=A0A976IDN8_BRELC|nr:hypothetical protein CCR75_008322 [Bremia lactucae]
MLEHAEMEHFDVVKLRSHHFDKGSDKPLKDVIYACEDNGEYISKAHENGRPVQKSRKSECPFQVKLKRDCSGTRDAVDDNTWSLKILHAGHNHEVADISS